MLNTVYTSYVYTRYAAFPLGMDHPVLMQEAKIFPKHADRKLSTTAQPALIIESSLRRFLSHFESCSYGPTQVDPRSR